MSIETPLIRSQRNWALPLMKPVLVNGYRFEYIIKVRVFISSPNLKVPIDVLVDGSSRSAPKISRIWTTGANRSSYGMYTHLPNDSFEES